MASLPITVLLYDGPLLCGFNVAIKGLNVVAVIAGIIIIIIIVMNDNYDISVKNMSMTFYALKEINI